MRLQVGTALGPYQILEALGAGGMGEVYRARDTRLDRVVAIKVLPRRFSEDPRLAARFDREARSLSSLSHPNICTLHDVGETDGVRFLVMEYLEGVSLADRLRQGALSPEQVLRHGIEIADALDAAHRRGIVHRDLKPANVVLTPGGAKLLDFGLARSGGPLIAPSGSGEAQAPTRTMDPLTAEGAIVGTLHYMAPEQAEGGEADARSDLFALGTLLYEMGTGRRAFGGRSQASIIAAILTSEPPPMSTSQPLTPPALDRVVRRCLAKDPEQRWQSSRDVMLELRWIAAGGAETESEPSAPARRAGRLRERRAWAALALALAAALGIALWSRDGSPTPEHPVRLSMELPEGTARVYLRVSPDGRRVAFAAQVGAERKLWLRSLDGATVRALPGTDDASFPFWSPDSRFIGFFAGGKLKKIDTAGGPPQLLCDAPGSFAMGSWNEDGTIVFSLVEAPEQQGLHRISADGGPSSPVKVADDSGRPFLALFPSFLPDGRRFLFRCGRLDRELEDVGLCLGSLDDAPVRVLVDAQAEVSRAEYAPSGHLLYVRGETLVAQPFDLDALRTAGEPVVVVEGVDHYGPMGLVNFSVSRNGVLVYLHTSNESRLVWKDRSGHVLDEIADPDDYSDLELSPDGKRLAIAKWDNKTRSGDIWILDLDREVATRFTTVKREMEAMIPVWSPDGSRIAYCAAVDAPPFLQLKGLADEEPEVLLPSTGTLQCPVSWSPDGKTLAFVDRHPVNGYDLYLLPLEDGKRKPVPLLTTEFNEPLAAFSPDGRSIVTVSDESGRPEVYLQPVGRPGLRRRISPAGGFFPRWRADGRELFFLDEDRMLNAVAIEEDGELRSGPPRLLFEIGGGNLLQRNYDVDPDGQRFVVAELAGESRPLPTVVLNWTTALSD